MCGPVVKYYVERQQQIRSIPCPQEALTDVPHSDSSQVVPHASSPPYEWARAASEPRKRGAWTVKAQMLSVAGVYKWQLLSAPLTTCSFLYIKTLVLEKDVFPVGDLEIKR